ncbi:hypothetical protein TNIN_385741 [Trichonephila inaurata madagascariensis]|uniref:Uncharacterized protein n=1 Tax=Trichonephila inaurata madagascariensis TaxID=2747483 RepID=A0A8X7CND0_9ARAC|nr:hypothetical protein TNIN_385741 [Trichonephila inaurata madagascariensis]
MGILHIQSLLVKFNTLPSNGGGMSMGNQRKQRVDSTQAAISAVFELSLGCLKEGNSPRRVRARKIAGRSKNMRDEKFLLILQVIRISPMI